MLFSVRRRYPAPGLWGHTSDRSGDPGRRNPRRDHRAVLDAPPLSANHSCESAIFRSDHPEGGEISAYYRSSCRAIGGGGRLYAPGASIDTGYSCRRHPGLGGVCVPSSGRWSCRAGASRVAVVLATDGCAPPGTFGKTGLSAAHLDSGRGLVGPLPELSRSSGSRVVLGARPARSQAGARLHRYLARQCPGICSDRLVGVLTVALPSLRFARRCLPENRSRPRIVLRRFQLAQLHYSRSRIRRGNRGARGGFFQGKPPGRRLQRWHRLWATRCRQ